jgi:hypothetical protein
MKVSPPARLVFLVLAAWEHGDDKVAWPSVGTIAELSGLGERTIRRALRELEAFGEVAGRVRKGQVTVYDIDPNPGHCGPPNPGQIRPEPRPNTTGTPATVAPKTIERDRKSGDVAAPPRKGGAATAKSGPVEPLNGRRSLGCPKCHSGWVYAEDGSHVVGCPNCLPHEASRDRVPVTGDLPARTPPPAPTRKDLT